MIKEFKIANPNKIVNSAIFRKETGCNLYMKDDGFYISGCESQSEANALIEAHNPQNSNEISITDKLANVGLSLDDLKTALGL